jgi:hypothetical protein
MCWASLNGTMHCYFDPDLSSRDWVEGACYRPNCTHHPYCFEHWNLKCLLEMYGQGQDVCCFEPLMDRRVLNGLVTFSYHDST